MPSVGDLTFKQNIIVFFVKISHFLMFVFVYLRATSLEWKSFAWVRLYSNKIVIGVDACLFNKNKSKITAHVWLLVKPEIKQKQKQQIKKTYTYLFTLKSGNLFSICCSLQRDHHHVSLLFKRKIFSIFIVFSC